VTFGVKEEIKPFDPVGSGAAPSGSTTASGIDAS
jgi:hypothetical protein